MKKLNLPGVIANALKVMAMKPFFAGDKNKKMLRPWAQKFMNGLITLEFLGYMGEDGYPKIVPVIQAQAASSSRIFLTKAPYSKMMKDLKDGQRVERRLPRRPARHLLCGDRQAVRHGAAHLRRDRLQQEVRARGLPRRTARPELDLRKA